MDLLLLRVSRRQSRCRVLRSLKQLSSVWLALPFRLHLLSYVLLLLLLLLLDLITDLSYLTFSIRCQTLKHSRACCCLHTLRAEQVYSIIKEVVNQNYQQHRYKLILIVWSTFHRDRNTSQTATLADALVVDKSTNFNNRIT